MDAIERLNVREAISDDKTKQKVRNRLDRLINTDEMGELFKVLAITTNKCPSPEGFTCGTRGT